MKKILSSSIKLSDVNFVLDGLLNSGKLMQEVKDFVVFHVKKHSGLKKIPFAFLTLWSLPN